MPFLLVHSLKLNTVDYQENKVSKFLFFRAWPRKLLKWLILYVNYSMSKNEDPPYINFLQ